MTAGEGKEQSYAMRGLMRQRNAYVTCAPSSKLRAQDSLQQRARPLPRLRLRLRLDLHAERRQVTLVLRSQAVHKAYYTLCLTQ